MRANIDKRIKLLKEILKTDKDIDDALEIIEADKDTLKLLGYDDKEGFIELLAEELTPQQLEDLYFEKVIFGG